MPMIQFPQMPTDKISIMSFWNISTFTFTFTGICKWKSYKYWGFKVFLEMSSAFDGTGVKLASTNIANLWRTKNKQWGEVEPKIVEILCIQHLMSVSVWPVLGDLSRVNYIEMVSDQPKTSSESVL